MSMSKIKILSGFLFASVSKKQTYVEALSVESYYSENNEEINAMDTIAESADIVCVEL